MTIRDEDLSQGVLHVNRWGVSGYTPRFAQWLMTNMALWSRQVRAAAAE